MTNTIPHFPQLIQYMSRSGLDWVCIVLSKSRAGLFIPPAIQVQLSTVPFQYSPDELNIFCVVCTQSFFGGLFQLCSKSWRVIKLAYVQFLYTLFFTCSKYRYGHWKNSGGHNTESYMESFFFFFFSRKYHVEKMCWHRSTKCAL